MVKGNSKKNKRFTIPERRVKFHSIYNLLSLGLLASVKVSLIRMVNLPPFTCLNIWFCFQKTLFSWYWTNTVSIDMGFFPAVRFMGVQNKLINIHALWSMTNTRNYVTSSLMCWIVVLQCSFNQDPIPLQWSGYWLSSSVSMQWLIGYQQCRECKFDSRFACPNNVTLRLSVGLELNNKYHAAWLMGNNEVIPYLIFPSSLTVQHNSDWPQFSYTAAIVWKYNWKFCLSWIF